MAARVMVSVREQSVCAQKLSRPPVLHVCVWVTQENESIDDLQSSDLLNTYYGPSADSLSPHSPVRWDRYRHSRLEDVNTEA